MAGSINKVILVGRLGRDPDLKHTPAGKAVASMSVATSEYWKDAEGERQEKTEWHRVVLWGKPAETAAKLLSKGKLVYIEGRLQTRAWADRDGNKRYTTEIIARDFQILSPRDGQPGPSDDDFIPPDGGFDEIPF